MARCVAWRILTRSISPALPCPCDTLIDGDARSLSIAAASIIAKVTRDRMMVALHEEHPGYNWRSNKGYGTAEHYSGLKAHGVTGHHRRSFAPIREILSGEFVWIDREIAARQTGDEPAA